jgi:flagellar biogenesis protein FliO
MMIAMFLLVALIVSAAWLIIRTARNVAPIVDSTTKGAKK